MGNEIFETKYKVCEGYKYTVKNDPYDKRFETRDEALAYANELRQMDNNRKVAKTMVKDILKKIGLTEDEFAKLVMGTVSLNLKTVEDGAWQKTVAELKVFDKTIELVSTNEINTDHGNWM